MVLTYKQQFNIKYKQPKNQSNTMKEIAKLSGVKLSVLNKIFLRGKGAFKSNRASVRKFVTSPEQWGYARVYASINPKSKASKSDADLLK
tara:strand:- start:754 stop:1023 length:270 start_codon:yes stop_codon:yes gene_type:complete